MKLSKISLYAFIFAISVVFIKILTQTYLNFFNNNGENKTVSLNRLKKIKLPPECNLEMILPDSFSYQNEIEISVHLDCEEDAINLISDSFFSSAAQKKFIKLANVKSSSNEVTWKKEDSFFNIQTTSVDIDRDLVESKTTIKIKNLNKKK
jgi:hypothetical protein